MHESALAFVCGQSRKRGPFRTVLDLGGRDVNGSPRGCFPGAHYTVVDIMDGDGVDVVADAATYCPGVTYQAVVCCEVLEHTPAAADIVHNAAKLLDPGGIFFVTTAMPPRMPHSAVDGGQLRAGEYYGNIMPGDLELWLVSAGFDGWHLTTTVIPNHGGDLYAVAWTDRS